MKLLRGRVNQKKEKANDGVCVIEKKDRARFSQGHEEEK